MPDSQSLHSLLAKRYSDVKDLAGVSNPTLLAMAARGSCRSYQSKPIESRLVDMLCALALASPTKSDLQQRDIIILEEKAQRTRITDLFPQDPWMAEAPLFLVFCGNNRRQRQISQWRSKPFANDHLDAFFNVSVDGAIALSAFVIAAESVGLGCCPVSAIRNYAAEVSNILALPDHVFPIAGLTVGWPQEKPCISLRLPLSTAVHRNTFSEAGLETQIEAYDQRREIHQPYKTQRYTESFGVTEHYGWSEDKARQYARPERSNFGDFIRRKGFNLK